MCCYEQWITVPLGSKKQQGWEPAVDVKDRRDWAQKRELKVAEQRFVVRVREFHVSLRHGLNINREFLAHGWILSDNAGSSTLLNVHTAAQTVDGKLNAVRMF